MGKYGTCTISIIISICKTLPVVDAMTACDLARNCYECY